MADATLDDVGQAVSDVLGQLKAIVRDGVQPAYAVLMQMCRRLPLRAYFLVVRAPTLGRIATFGFSDTGATLSSIEQFAGVPIARARHFPANIHPPGFTVVSTRYRGRLQICTSYLEGAVTAQEYERYEAHLRADLTGDTP